MGRLTAVAENVLPGDRIGYFLALGTPEAIGRNLAERGASLDSSVGRAAGIACDVLGARQVAETAKVLDRAATRLQFWGLGIAGASLVVSVVALVVSLAPG